MAKLKLVVNNTTKQPTANRWARRGLTHKQLMRKLDACRGSYLDREQIVVQNLRDMGLTD